MEKENKKKPELAGRCGLYCGSCSLYLGTKEDSGRLEMIARILGQSLEDTKCEGCRSSLVSKHCRSCKFKTCNEEKNISFCGECPDYPCKEFTEFMNERPHRRDIERDMKEILDEGPEKWLSVVHLRYACPKCSTVNSAYDLSCRKCGQEPSSLYTVDHAEFIKKYLNK